MIEILQLIIYRMSVLISNCEQICHSPSNQSKAKMLYSFSKSLRFKTVVNNECDQFYDLSGKSQKRATSLGYGKKYDFTRDMPKTPAPGAYESQTLFEESRRKNKGTGFGSGRGQMQSTGFLKKNENPGPGAYQSCSSANRIAFSLKSKARIDNREQIYVPGPGTYENNSTFNKSGINFCSKFRNKPGSIFGKQNKLKYRDYRVPGPGNYDFNKISLSPEGKYSLSRLQSAKTTKFGRSKRMGIEPRPQTPGPGNYRLPSEFGYYIDKNTFTNPSNVSNFE